MIIYKTDNYTKNIIINIGKDIKQPNIHGGSDKYEILIKFGNSSLMQLNKYIDHFSFLKLYNKNGQFKVAYDDVFSNNQQIEISKINEIKFIIIENLITIIINNDIKNKQIKQINFDINSITSLELLNNFYGEISSISIIKSFLKIPDDNSKDQLAEIIKQDLYIDIKDYQLKFSLKLNNEEQNNKSNDIIKYEGEIFCDDYKKICKQNSLCNIIYYGGLQCFIPLIKLINYIIQKLNINKNEINEEIINDNNINKPIQWIKDILKIILKLICLSEDNYSNFQKIVVPLIGSIAEIYNTLKNLKNNYSSLLFKDEIFFIIYILILNSTLPYSVKKIYKDLFNIDENFTNFNFSMKSLIFNLNNNSIEKIEWYFIFIFNFIEFLMLYFDSTKKIPNELINQLTEIYSYMEKEISKKIENINFDNLIKNSNEINAKLRSSYPFICFIKEYCLDEKIDSKEIFSQNNNKLK